MAKDSPRLSLRAGTEIPAYPPRAGFPPASRTAGRRIAAANGPVKTKAHSTPPIYATEPEARRVSWREPDPNPNPLLVAGWGPGRLRRPAEPPHLGRMGERV